MTNTTGLRSAGMWSLAISVPDQLITNDFWRRRQPQAIAEAEQRIWMWKKGDTPKETDDPFHHRDAALPRRPLPRPGAAAHVAAHRQRARARAGGRPAGAGRRPS